MLILKQLENDLKLFNYYCILNIRVKTTNDKIGISIPVSGKEYSMKQCVRKISLR